MSSQLLDSNDGMESITDGEDEEELLPQIYACFLIRFDKRIGYTIAWNRARDGLNIDGVEFKSLPSGLHEVNGDLVYFIHGQHIGLNAFKRSSAAVSERNAAFASVGVLLPRQTCENPNCWLYTKHLQRLANLANENDKAIIELEKFWRKHSENVGSIASQNSSTPKSEMTRYHPARTMLDTLDQFGPLLFPLYRATLLRYRILVITKPPVQAACNLVHVLSFLSTLPLAASNIIQDATLMHPKPLFNIGINDITHLQSLLPQRANDSTEGSITSDIGWIACTSDALIATKIDLYNLKVDLSSTSSHPTICLSSGGQIKGTQRDARRYHRLRHALSASTDIDFNVQFSDAASNQDETPLLRTRSQDSRASTLPRQISEHRESTDALPWPAAAYESIMSWTWADESAAGLDAEDEHDQELYDDVRTKAQASTQQSVRRVDAETVISSPLPSPEETVIAYFRGWTASILGTLAGIVESETRAHASQNTADTPFPGRIYVAKDDLVRMGLDVWSERDKEFVRAMSRKYFGVEADVAGASVELCGMRIY